MLLLCALLSTPARAQRFLQEVFPLVDSTVGISYGEAPNWDGTLQNLALDVYWPSDDSSQDRPMILFFHGGSFLSGQRNDALMVSLCQTFAKRGYVTATASYRLGVNVANITTLDREFVKAALRATHDAKAAVRYFRRTVAEMGNPYRIDTSKIYVGGYSAGAIAAIHLAYFTDTTASSALVNQEIVALGQGLEGSSGNTGYNSRAAAVMNIAGAVLDTLIVPQNAVPAIHFHGTNDEVVPYDRNLIRASGFPVMVVDGSSLLHPRLLNRGSYSELLSYNANHALVADPSISSDIISNAARFFYNFQNNSVATEPINAATFKAYPNPVRDALQIEWKAPGAAQIELRNAQGQVVLQTSLNPGESLPMSELPAGTYLLRVQQNNQSYSPKIILKHD